jgi:hypothetical protein
VRISPLFKGTPRAVPDKNTTVLVDAYKEPTPRKQEEGVCLAIVEGTECACLL